MCSTPSFSLLDWCALAPGRASRDAWLAWATQEDSVAPWVADAPLPAANLIPMMTARRMSSGSRLAIQAALTLAQTHTFDAVV
ncbi:MAG: beta-ketoacyl synthase chain length factor, partial [Puniceicoccales bacterium]|nr:beta-ketoacyl synthase chain length factor [Puniceicoccales bacterium]